MMGAGQGRDYKGHNGYQISEALLVSETVKVLDFMYPNGMILGQDS